MQEPLLDLAPSTPAPTPAVGWPAQPALTADETFVKIVREDVTRLLGVASTLENAKQLRSVAVREDLRRALAGVVAHCETVRLALEKGRGA